MQGSRSVLFTSHWYHMIVLIQVSGQAVKQSVIGVKTTASLLHHSVLLVFVIVYSLNNIIE